MRADQTLVDVHDALQGAFGWDDDHLYSFWLKGKFWARDGSEYTHPFHAAQPNPLGPFAIGPPPGSATARLDRVRLSRGQRIAYLFDFGDEWRVTLTVSDVTTDDGLPYPRLVEATEKHRRSIRNTTTKRSRSSLEVKGSPATRAVWFGSCEVGGTLREAAVRVSLSENELHGGRTRRVTSGYHWHNALGCGILRVPWQEAK